MKGGYQIIDVGGITISSTPVKVEGIYNKIKNANGKPLLIGNFKMENVVCDTFSYTNYISYDDGSYLLTGTAVPINIGIIVTTEDMVSILSD